MKTLTASELKERCLWIVDHLDSEGLIITKQGRPVARLLPVEHTSAELIGALAGHITIKDDILSTTATWDSHS